MFDPSAHLLASVCDNLSCLGLQGCRLLCWFSGCLLDALIHGPDVAGVRGLLNVLEQLEPVVVCAAACCLLGLTAYRSQCLKIVLTGVTLVVDQRGRLALLTGSISVMLPSN